MMIYNLLDFHRLKFIVLLETIVTLLNNKLFLQIRKKYKQMK